MKFTLSWLKDFLETEATIDQIAVTLTNIGLEVENIVDRSEVFQPFTVAHIIEATQHPNADRLRVCRVDIGNNEVIQVVCGGKNARTGIKVVIAKVGTVIPTNQLKMKLSKIRDVESHGMLVSLDEMGIGESDGGIIELPNDAVIGEPFAKYLGLDDPVIELSITPNRGDCLGVYGIARDLAAAGLGTLKKLEISKIVGNFNSPIAVDIGDKENCPRFIGRYFKNVANIESPMWLQNRLKAVGNNPISALVDITNYISLTFGRPLHVYDADKLLGNISVRRAKSEESFLALNEKQYLFNDSELVVSDSNNIVALAGIIGGMDSAVTNDTKNVFLEVAYFKADKVAADGRIHKIDTDARYRFERNIDPNFMEDGAAIASSMIMEICGGEASKLVEQNTYNNVQNIINISFEYIERLSGIKINSSDIIRILKSFGFGIIKESDNFLEVSIPSYRQDVTQKCDLVEEILRIYGYDNIPAISINLPENIPNRILTTQQIKKNRIRRILSQQGYFETITWSFMSKTKAELFTSYDESLELLNPIHVELNYMRPTIISNLLEAIVKNKNRRFESISLFEIGPIFKSSKPEDFRNFVSGVRYGKDCQKNMFSRPRDFDPYDIKSDIYTLINECGFNPSNLIIEQKLAPIWGHPGKSAAIKIGKEVIGYFGEVHPKITKLYDINDRVFAFEISVQDIVSPKLKRGKKPIPTYSDFQVIQRDFAFIVDKEVPSERIIKSIVRVNNKLISSADIFDLYEGINIESGKKSIAVNVKIQSPDGTLTDDEIEALSREIIDSVNKETNAVVRSH